MDNPLPSPLPWERQKGESRQAFRAFVIYRDMGPKRTLAAVCDELAPGRVGADGGPRRDHRFGRVRIWAERQWDWARRAEAYDADEDRIAREAFEQRRLEARLSRLDMYDATLAVGFRVMDKFRRDVESGQLEKLNLAREKVKERIRLKDAPDGTPRFAFVESERRAITDLVAPLVPAIAEAARGQRLDYGEATDRTEADVNLKAPDLVRALAHLLRDRLTDVEFDAVEEELAGLLGDNGVPSPSAAEG